MKKFEKTLFALFIALGLCFVLNSCSEDADIDISCHIYYGTGSYAQVSRIEFTVSGGEAPYKLYYARSISDRDYAKKNRTYIGKCNENETFTYYLVMFQLVGITIFGLLTIMEQVQEYVGILDLNSLII